MAGQGDVMNPGNAIACGGFAAQVDGATQPQLRLLLYLKCLYDLLGTRIFAVPVVRAEVVKLADTPSAR